jgi:CRISPR-associated endonuclease/helicase Cas3
MNLSDFNDTFLALTNNPPFPWQQRLYAEWSNGKFNSAGLALPTGVGKTSVIAIWLILRAEGAPVPTRLVYVVNRRTVVDQTTEEVEKLSRNLIGSPLNQKLREQCALEIPEGESALAASTLRGQMADNRIWSADPCRPAVIVGTVDMIGSGLLFNRYGVGFKLRPHHAAFLAQDALIIHDEAHLEPAFQNLLEAIVNLQAISNDPRKLRAIALTATSRNASQSEHRTFSLTEDDKISQVENGVEKNIILQRIHATKHLRLLGVDAGKNVLNEIARLALEKKDADRAVLIFVRSVEVAEKVATELSTTKDIGIRRVATLTGTMRGKERLVAHGSYPDVPLREARAKRDAIRVQLAEGTDPTAQKRLDQIEAETKARNTFFLVAEE